nr:hypothetical protein [Streptomyces sp. S584]
MSQPGPLLASRDRQQAAEEGGRHEHTARDRPAAPHRVLILGAGYAGRAAAIQLAARVRRQRDVLVTLVNAQDRFTERLRLHMAATGQQLGELSIPELLDGTGAEFVRG